MTDATHCWLCNSPNVYYTDVVKIGWCEKHFRDIFLNPIDYEEVEE